MPSVEMAMRGAWGLYQTGEWPKAEQICASVLQTEPLRPDSMALLALIAAQTQRTAQALDLSGRLVAARPDDPFALLTYANVLRLSERLDEALRSCERALRLKPDLLDAEVCRGSTLHRLGRFTEALESRERVLQHRPDSAEAHICRGSTLQMLGRLEEALQSHERALQLRPGAFEAHNNRGNVLQALGRFDEALLSFERAVQLNPESAEAHCNRGALLQMLMRPDEALQSLNRAIGIRPQFAMAHYNRACAALLAGDYATGWREFEWRWKAFPSLVDPRFPDRTLWLGEQSLRGKRILLHSELGFGDTLQFCRYVTQIAALGAHVILEAQGQLVRLMGSLDGVSQVVAQGQALPTFDLHCPLMSLPLAAGTTLSTIPSHVPYLASDPAKTRFWREKLGPWTKPRVGLVWSGGSRLHQRDLWSLNSHRNMPLARLAALRGLNAAFYSLQKGQPAESELRGLEEAGWQGPEVTDHTMLLQDFSDTAALVANLDLVIAVDTSTAHLAGAMGKPVWIMNRHDNCWRWLINRSDSPWYPTARLYRQQRPGDWDGVVDRIRSDLLAARFVGRT